MKMHSIYETEEDVKKKTQALCNHEWEVGAHNLVIIGLSRCMRCGKLSEPNFFNLGDK